MDNGKNSSTVPLRSDDLDLLQRFLEAWCEEHHVDVSDGRAAEVASALIDWYRSGMTDRDLLKCAPPAMSPNPASIQLLMRQLSER